MPTIETGGGNRARNDGEYVFNYSKWVQLRDLRQAGVEETEGYRERSADDDEMTQRVFLVPWNLRHTFREVMRGYATSDFTADGLAWQAALAADPIIADAVRLGRPLPAAIDITPPANAAQIFRVPPMQDGPDRPFLFCTDLEMLGTHGAWMPDPYDTFTDPPVLLEPTAAGGIRFMDTSTGDVRFMGRPGGGMWAKAPPPDVGIDPLDGSGIGRAAVAPPLGLPPRDPTIYRADQVTGPSGVFRDGKCTFRATFRSPPYNVLSDAEMLFRGFTSELSRYVSRDEEYSLEAIQLPRSAQGASALRFTAGLNPAGQLITPPSGVINAVINQAGVQQVPRAILNYTHWMVPDRPMEAYLSCIGRINDRPFDGYDGAPLYQKGTLLCQSWTTRRRVGPTGRVQWMVRFRLAWNPVGWNFFPNGGSFYYATFSSRLEVRDTGVFAVGDPDATPVYLSANFDRLFQPALPTRYMRPRA